ncbi:MAG: PKD domain-containing protein, partial [Bacteroidales bacterium]|nr:PKD domain-containing protein [Bacteroidales bacterium]
MDPNYTISNNGNDTIVCKVPDTIRIDGVTGNNYRWSIPTTDIGNTYSGRTYQPKFYSSHVGSHKVIVEITDIGSGCKLTDSSITIHVYREIDAVATITDTNECDPAHSIRFQNGTQYPWPDDFGFAVTTWDFGDGSPTVNSHDITRTYANYGDYRVAMTAITPYGCLLKTVYQDVHIFEMRALAAISDPAPPSPPDGCAPHTVEITHILDSLKSSHPIVSYLWSFDFNGDKSDVLIGNATDDVVNHTYPDTGKFDVYLTLTNSAGCSIDIFVNQIKVGHPPRVGFTFESDTNCKSEINIRVMAFDSVDAYDNLVPGDSAYADDWQWIDPESGNPVATGDTTTITPTVVGKPYEIILQASHNGCPSEFPIQLEVGYMCPPLASIKEPKDRPDGSPPLLCGIETVNFVPDDAGGAIWMKWFAGDVMDPKDAADTSKQTSSGWLHKDSTTAGAWEFLYSDSVIEALDGMFTITLMTYNDSSSSDPKYFNLCGYCEDMAQKQLLISYAKMNFTLNQETVCERDSIVFYDSTYSNVGLFGWGFKFDYAQDTNNVEDYMKENGSFAPDKMAEFANYTPMPSKGTGGKMYFSKPNRYRAVLIDTCAFTCVRYDTLYFTVYPKSDPGYLTSLDSVSFRRRNQDTLCFNSNDPLYVQDNSSTRWPFDTTKIVKWRWILDKDTQYTQNAALYVVNGAGLYTLGLQVTNEYGCAEQELDVNNDRNQVLVAEVDASFEAGGGKNEFCNQSEISFENRSMVYPNSVYATGTTIIKTVWDWGDGTTDSTFTLIPNIYGSGAYPKAYHTYHFQTPVNKVGVTMRVSVYAPGGPIGCEDVYTDSLTISGPVADFAADGVIFPCPDDNEIGGRGRRIQFRNQSLGNVVTLIWNFGDTLGGSSNRTIGPITDSAYVAPIHTY